MTEIATQGQLRMSYLRWALVTVPAIVLIGSLIGLFSNNGFVYRCFSALYLPPVTPPPCFFFSLCPFLFLFLLLSLPFFLPLSFSLLFVFFFFFSFFFFFFSFFFF